MADQFPLVVKSGVVQELESGDNLNLTGNKVVGINSITFANGATFSGATGIGSTLKINVDMNLNGLVVGRGANGSVGFATLGSSEVATNISLGTGQILAKFVGVTTGGGSPNIGIGNSVLINYTGIGSTSIPGSYFGNVAIGVEALSNLTQGGGNYAIGRAALYSTKTGSNNVAIGDACMIAAGINQAGGTVYGGAESEVVDDNIAVGGAALFRARSSANVAVGREALLRATTGEGSNTAVGTAALKETTTGSSNVAIGASAGYVSIAGTFSGNTTGSNNVFLGAYCLGPTAATSNTINLGNHNHSSLRCNVQTITGLSDGRDKTDIEELPLGLEFVSSLAPVKFTWNRRDDSILNGTQDAGFIAQELQTVVADHSAEWFGLVSEENPEVLEASYSKLIPVLVKAIQELKAKNDTLKARLDAAGL